MTARRTVLPPTECLSLVSFTAEGQSALRIEQVVVPFWMGLSSCLVVEDTVWEKGCSVYQFMFRLIAKVKPKAEVTYVNANLENLPKPKSHAIWVSSLIKNMYM